MNIIFMGTPKFVIPTLKEIHKYHNLQAIFTQTDKPNSRGNKIIFSPVKNFALENNILLFQPLTLKSEEIYEKIKGINPDIIIVAAYKKMVPDNIINLGKYKAINVHPSLLPKYRGSSPIKTPLLNGEKESGVTIIELCDKMDAGDILIQKKIKISENENFETLHDKLSILSSECINEFLNNCKHYFKNKKKQDENLATFTQLIKKEQLRFDFDFEKKKLINLTKAFAPFPGTYAFFKDKRVKIFEIESFENTYNSNKNGEIVDFVKRKGIVVKVSAGFIVIKELQFENKKRISGSDSINSNIFQKGDCFE